MSQRVVDHLALFNACVRSGDWKPFAATFAEDARMEFSNVPVPPMRGREAILAGYETRPPDDTMRLESVTEVDADTDRVRFAWDRGGLGTMVVRWSGDKVAAVTVTFDEGQTST